MDEDNIKEQLALLSAEVRGSTELVTVKIDGITRRLDISNGRIAKAEEKVAGLDSRLSALDAKETAHIKKADNRVWDMFKMMLMFIAGVLGYLGAFLFNNSIT